MPLFILPIVPPLVGTARLLSSTPTDLVVFNNTATISVFPAPAFQGIVIQRIAPNPSTNNVVIELESATADNVTIGFSDAFGQTVKSENRAVTQGLNRLQFDIQALPKGVYFVVPSANVGQNKPLKFVKM